MVEAIITLRDLAEEQGNGNILWDFNDTPLTFSAIVDALFFTSTISPEQFRCDHCTQVELKVEREKRNK